MDYEDNGEKDDIPLASADAVVEEDVVLWEWHFSKLKSFLKGEREVSNALSAYVNHDLRRKLINAGAVMTKKENRGK